MSKINIRPAVFSDSFDLFSWRNDPLSIQMSKKMKGVPLEEHERWFQAALGDVKGDPVITLSNIKQTSNLMYRMIDINKSLDNPLYQNEAILSLHFGIKDEEFSHLIKSVHVE